MINKFRDLFDEENLIVLGPLALFATAMAIISLGFNFESSFGDWLSSFTQGFATELVGGIMTYTLIDRVMEQRTELKQLINDMRSGSANKSRARAATEIVRVQGYHANGVLSGMVLNRSYLCDANWPDANLMNTQFKRADMRRMNLRHAKLQDTDFTRADLSYSDLQFADLTHANLMAMDLSSVNLLGAKLDKAQFNDHTRLPDGTMWTPQTDMTRFTDDRHPNFYPVDVQHHQ